MQAFLEGRKPGAYERPVDRILGSREYGQYAARPWLDIIRYSEGNGFLRRNESANPEVAVRRLFNLVPVRPLVRKSSGPQRPWPVLAAVPTLPSSPEYKRVP